MKLIFTILYFLGAGFAFLPLPWVIRKRPLNIPVLMSAFWLIQYNLFLGINSIIWRDNVERKMLVYCDIGLGLVNASRLGLLTAAFCLAQNLEHILSPATRNHRQKHRHIIDFSLCIVLPLLYAAAYVCVQSNRFNIFEEIGCVAAPWMSWPFIFVWYLVPAAFMLTTSTFAVLAFQWLRSHRAALQEVLKRSRGGMTPFQVNRLMALVLFEACLFFIVMAYNLSGLKTEVFYAYSNWAFAHAGFSVIDQFPSAVVPDGFMYQQQLKGLEVSLSGFVYFLLFGFNAEIYGALGRAAKFLLQVARRALGAKFTTSSTVSQPLDTIGSFNSKSIVQYDKLDAPTYPPPITLPPSSRTFELPPPPARPSREGAESPRPEDDLHPSQPSIPSSVEKLPNLGHGRRSLKMSIDGKI